MSLEELGYCAFSGTVLESIEIPKSLTYASVYDYSTSYTYNGVQFQFKSGPFGGVDTLKLVSFEEGTTVIAGSLFRGCTGIEEIVIPDTVEVIHGNAFNHCVRLNSVTIGSGVKTIGEYAFEHCISLTNVNLPDSVTKIQKYAFSSCTLLTEIIFDGDVPAINTTAFNAVTSPAYYPEDNATWTEEVMKSYGGTLTWLPYCRIPGRVDSWNVSLSDNLIVNFYMKINEKIADTARVRIYVGDTSVTEKGWGYGVLGQHESERMALLRNRTKISTFDP